MSTTCCLMSPMVKLLAPILSLRGSIEKLPLRNVADTLPGQVANLNGGIAVLTSAPRTHLSKKLHTQEMQILTEDY